jgi:hypothetical protein
MNALMRFALKSSVAALLAAGVMTGCGSDKDDSDQGGAAGEPSNGGSDNSAGTNSNEGRGGADAAGGMTDGGLNPGGAAGSSSGGEKTAGGEASGGASPQGGASGSAVAKFCNSIILTTDDGEGGAAPVDNDTTFRLELGEGDDVVKLTATTGECAPVDGDSCTPIPVGDVPYKLIYIDEDAVETELDFGSVPMIADGEEWYFWSEIFEENPVLAGGPEASLVCADATFDDIVPTE